MKAAALELGIPVSHRVRDVLDSRCELAVVVAFGRIIPAEVLAEVPMVNLHLSLLPRWRGAAPVERAILSGDAITGVSLMALDAGLDTGPVYAAIPVAIDPREHAEGLTLRLGELGTSELLERLKGGVAGLGQAEPQVGETSYAEKLSIDDHRLDFGRSATQCARVIQIGRAFSSFRGKRLIVHEAHVATPEEIAGLDTPANTVLSAPPGSLLVPLVSCADGLLALDVVQLEGRARQRVVDFANGVHPKAGELLGSADGADEL